MNLGLRCLPLLLVLPLAGQATVRQGTLADVRPSEFFSPMVIELPMDRLKLEEPGNIYTFTDQEKYICDDASLRLVVVRKAIKDNPKRVELRIESTVYVRPSFDRKVTLRYSIVSAGKPLAAVSEQEISAKEKQYRSDSSTLVISKEEFDGLFEGDRHGILKAVMTVTPDR